MQKLSLFPLLAVSAFLSACGASDGSPAEGQYQQTVKITDLEFPGIAGEARDRTIREMESAGSSKFCLSGGEGGKQWKEAASQMAGALGGNCDTVKDEGSATRIDLEMKCAGTEKGDMEVKMLGRSTTEGFDSKMSFEMKDPDSGKSANLAMNVNAKRIGDCPG